MVLFLFFVVQLTYSVFFDDEEDRVFAHFASSPLETSVVSESSPLETSGVFNEWLANNFFDHADELNYPRENTLETSVVSGKTPPETSVVSGKTPPETSVVLQNSHSFNSLPCLSAPSFTLSVSEKSEIRTTLETSGEDIKNTPETSGEDIKNTLETSGEDQWEDCRLKKSKIYCFKRIGKLMVSPVTLETSGEDVKIHSKRVEKM